MFEENSNAFSSAVRRIVHPNWSSHPFDGSQPHLYSDFMRFIRSKVEAKHSFGFLLTEADIRRLNDMDLQTHNRLQSQRRFVEHGLPNPATGNLFPPLSITEQHRLTELINLINSHNAENTRQEIAINSILSVLVQYLSPGLATEIGMFCNAQQPLDHVNRLVLAITMLTVRYNSVDYNRFKTNRICALETTMGRPTSIQDLAIFLENHIACGNMRLNNAMPPASHEPIHAALSNFIDTDNTPSTNGFKTRLQGAIDQQLPLTRLKEIVQTQLATMSNRSIYDGTAASAYHIGAVDVHQAYPSVPMAAAASSRFMKAPAPYGLQSSPSNMDAIMRVAKHNDEDQGMHLVELINTERICYMHAVGFCPNDSDNHRQSLNHDIPYLAIGRNNKFIKTKAKEMLKNMFSERSRSRDRSSRGRSPTRSQSPSYRDRPPTPKPSNK